jgi:multidrug resistance efflux pump
MKRAIGLLVTLATVGCASQTTTANDASGAPAVASATARFGAFTSRVHAAGRVGSPAGSESKLSFSGSGIVQSVDVRIGEHVQAGQSLMELDTTGLALDARQARLDALAAANSYANGAVGATGVASARAKLAAAKERLAMILAGTATTNSDASAAATAVRQSQEKIATDQRALDRTQQLYRGGVTAAKDVEAARTTLRLDQADLAANESKQRATRAGVGEAAVQAEADVRQAQNDLDVALELGPVAQAQAASSAAKAAQARRLLANGILRAPTDGVVLQILKHAGEAADPAAPAVVIGPATDRAVTLAVSSADSADVHPGESVALRIAVRGLRATGIVRAVVPAVDPATQSATVVVQGVPAGAVAGDAVDATIAVGVRRGVVVPTSAVVQDPQSGNTLVFVRAKHRDGVEKFASRTVVVAAGDDRTTLLASGLHAGDVVAAQGAFDLLAPVGGGG